MGRIPPIFLICEVLPEGKRYAAQFCIFTWCFSVASLTSLPECQINQVLFFIPPAGSQHFPHCLHCLCLSLPSLCTGGLESCPVIISDRANAEYMLINGLVSQIKKSALDSAKEPRGWHSLEDKLHLSTKAACVYSGVTNDKYLLGIYYVPGILWDTRDMAVNKTIKIPTLKGV